MTPLEMDDMYSKIKDIHQMMKDVWTSLKMGDPNDDAKDFMMNIAANLFANKIEGNVGKR